MTVELLKNDVINHNEFNGVYISSNIMHISNLDIIDKYILALYEQYKDIVMVKKLLNDAKICSKSCMQKHIKNLERNGLLPNKNITPIEAKKLTIELVNSNRTCEWCGNRSYVLEAHHYPIPRHLGGTEIVNICPNCHATFHHIMNNIKKS